MRALYFGVLVLAGLVSQATAQQSFGPITVKNDINGVPIAVSATSWITVKSDADENLAEARIRIFADLIDLQRKFSKAVATIKPSVNDCANRGVDNLSPIVSLKSGSLWPRHDQLVMSIRGDIDIWSCIDEPRKSIIVWRKKKIGFINIKLPALHSTTKVRKNKDGTQPFRGSLLVNLSDQRQYGSRVEHFNA